MAAADMTLRRSPRLTATKACQAVGSTFRPPCTRPSGGNRCVEATTLRQDEENIKMWRGRRGYDAWPDEFIECPLPATHPLLNNPYSLSNRWAKATYRIHAGGSRKGVCSTVEFSGWLTGWLAGLLVGRPAGWTVGWQAGWLASWLAGRGLFAVCLS